MATNTYVALDKVTVGTATATVTFNSIPQGYTDLVIVAQVLGNSSTNLKFRINNDTTSNYSGTYIFGTGSSAGSGRVSNQTSALAYGSGITNGSFILQFMNYSNTTTNKTVLCRGDDASNQTNAWVDLYRSTSAITRIDLLGDAANFSVGSTFSLYGIASEAAAAKATGGYITSDATYFYHTFLASGTFTPKQSLTADMLCVAGGGGGYAGGGGAGGLLGLTSQSLTATGYTVTIGAGGVGGASKTSGTNSQFGGLTAAVGGGYGGAGNEVGATGGSGGGGGWSGGGGMAGGSGTSGQGNAGGQGDTSNGGGGGGAGGAGTSAGTTNNAGLSSSAYNSWGSVTGTGELYLGNYTYAGGGATNGTAKGGGGGGTNNTGVGLANTGGGGKGNFAGGSGVVIVRYLKA